MSFTYQSYTPSGSRCLDATPKRRLDASERNPAAETAPQAGFGKSRQTASRVTVRLSARLSVVLAYRRVRDYRSVMVETSPAVRCIGLVKRYPDVTAVNQLDLTIQRGECFGLLGPNGAGKTTTIEILEGLTEPDAGSVEVLGLTWKNNAREIRERIGVQLQDTQLGDKLTVLEVLTLFRSLYRDGKHPEDLLDWFSLRPKANARYHKLSGGQKQRVVLACALVSNPELLFLDEPTTGLDPQARLAVWNVVQRYKAEGGTVLLTTHYMEEAARLCDRLAIVDEGKLIAQGTPEELTSSLASAQVLEVKVESSTSPHAEPPPQLGFKQRGEWWVKSIDNAHSELGHAIAQLLDGITSSGLRVIALRTHQPTLDDVFLARTGKALRDG
jgi:ABC-2 type transport system ATP-binding protein